MTVTYCIKIQLACMHTLLCSDDFLAGLRPLKPELRFQGVQQRRVHSAPGLPRWHLYSLAEVDSELSTRCEVSLHQCFFPETCYPVFSRCPDLRVVSCLLALFLRAKPTLGLTDSRAWAPPSANRNISRVKSTRKRKRVIYVRR